MYLKHLNDILRQIIFWVSPLSSKTNCKTGSKLQFNELKIRLIVLLLHVFFSILLTMVKSTNWGWHLKILHFCIDAAQLQQQRFAS